MITGRRIPGLPRGGALRAAALAALVAAGAPLPAAQELDRAEDPLPPVAASESQRAAKENGCMHVLRLADGRVLRRRARSTEQGWEVRDGSEWIALPADAVTSARREKDLLEQARRLERETRSSDLTRRVAYCDWLLREGLHEEGLEALDAVLAKDPDQADAVALLARTQLSLGLPELDPAMADLDAFLGRAARFGPAARELAVAELRTGPEVPGLLERVRADLEHRDSRRRSFAALVLRRMFRGHEVKPLLARAVLDANEDVRRQAALALRDVGDPAVVLPVVRALGSSHHQVRVNATEALGHMAYPAVVPTLVSHLTSTLQSSGGGRTPHSHIYVGRQVAYVQDYDVEVAQNESIADPVINVLQEGSVLDAGVLGVTEYQLATERATTRRALAQLTGADPGHTTVAWARWWEENGAAWGAGLPPAASSPTSPKR